MSSLPPHGGPAVLTWQHGSTSSPIPPTTWCRPMQAVGRGLRGGCCSSGDSASGFVHSRLNRPGDGHRPDPAWPMNLRRARQRGETLGSCPGARHAACLRVRCPARRGVGRHGSRSQVEVLAPRPSIGVPSPPLWNDDEMPIPTRFPRDPSSHQLRPAQRPAPGVTQGPTTEPVTELPRRSGRRDAARLECLDSTRATLRSPRARRRGHLWWPGS